MTPNEINRAIVEECGWKPLGSISGDVYVLLDDKRQIIQSACIYGSVMHKYRLDIGIEGGTTPNYHGDLNAMHEAEKILICEEPVRYVCYLIDILANWKDNIPRSALEAHINKQGCFSVATATATQRAEAFLRTKNKWKE